MKTRRIISVVMATATALFSACPAMAQRAAKENKMDPKKYAAVTDANTAFGLSLYGKLAEKEKGNIFFSPASIHVAVSMAFAGARGATAQQMAKVMGLDGKPEEIFPAFQELLKAFNSAGKDHEGKPVYQLSMVNRLWGKNGYPFKEDYLELAKKDFLSDIIGLNFSDEPAARKTINDWVAEQTKDKIKNLIPPGVIDNMTRLIITNAVYFKANWAEKFNKEVTKDGDFFAQPEKPVKVRMMRQEHRFGYAETDDLQVLEMPYKNHELSMAILLPKKADGLAAMEKSLSADSVKKLMEQAKPAQVDVTLPKFKFESSFSLGDMLKAMGMTAAFGPSVADFTGIADVKNEPLYISAVLHKAFVAVDEEGTEAAAATAVLMAAGCAPMQPEKPKVFKADHPFVFMIRHAATGEILFMGRIADPTK
ncbi:MAG: serpin family protein [Planctomycetes bacterium]|nr:serpin family protein [Planctomycetota bacterium]